MAKMWKHFSMFVVLVMLMGVVPAIVPASPAQANVSNITVAPYDSNFISAPTGYSVVFTSGATLDATTTITIWFPAGTEMPASLTASNYYINGFPCTVSASVTGDNLTLAVPTFITPGQVTVGILPAAGMANPPDSSNSGAGRYTVNVWTSAEPTPVTSSAYTINGIDRWTGDTWQDSYTTIQAAIDDAADSDNITVPAGTYTEVGQIVISRNLSIVGADKATTIIKPDRDTSASGDPGGWWLVNPGIAFNLSDVTLDGTGYKISRGIRHKGTGTIQNVHFTNLQYEASGPTYGGFAIYAFGQVGAVDVSDCVFDNIGREGIAYWGAGTTGTYARNTYNGKGLGDWLDYAVEVSTGAVVSITGSTITNNLGTATSDGSNSAGIIVLQDGSTATITGNTITGNDIAIKVGYNTPASSATAHAHDNAIYNNTSGSVRGTLCTGVFDATDNWWGSAYGPTNDNNVFNVGIGSPGDPVSSGITYVQWLSSEGGATFAGPISNGTNYYSNFTDAIAWTAEGGAINAVAGTYTEDFWVNKALTLSGAEYNVNPAATGSGWTGNTIIKPTATGNPSGQANLDGYSPQLQASNVTFQGFKVMNGTAPGFGLYIGGDAVGPFENITVQNCELTGMAKYGVQVAAMGGTVLSDVRVNQVYAHSNTRNGIKTVNVNNPTISSCKITNNAGAGDYGYGIWIGATNDTVSIPSTITGNVFSGNTVGAILLKQASGTNQDTTGTLINYNNFSSDPTKYGINNALTPIRDIDGKFNYWGSENGTTHTDPMLGVVTYGAKVSDNVTFQPWLIATYSTAPTGEISVTNASYLLPDGQTGETYSATLTSDGGTGTRTWSYYSACTTPPGLSVSSGAGTGTGSISGTPTVPQNDPTGYKFGIMVKDTVQAAYKAFELPVYSIIPVITTTSLANGRVGTLYSENLTATGGTGTFTWSIYTGSLPPGLNIIPTTGSVVYITGTPTTPGIYNFRVKVVSGGLVGYKDLSIQIIPLGEKITSYLNGGWYLDYNGNGAWNGSTIDRLYGFGNASMKPVTGNWNGTGGTEIGTYLNGAWYLDYNGNGVWNNVAGGDRLYYFGNASMTPVSGDWDNNRATEIATYLNGAWYLDYNGNGVWDNVAGGDRLYGFGNASMTPVSGDWYGL